MREIVIGGVAYDTRNALKINGKQEWFSNESGDVSLAVSKFGPIELFSLTRTNWLPTAETYSLSLYAAGVIEKYVYKHAKRPISVADIGTGSGVIAITIAHHLKELIKKGQVSVHAVDISGDALQVAEANANYNKLNGLINFQIGNVLEGFTELDAVVSNPPFSRTGEVEYGWFNVMPFATKLALDGGMDGLDFYRKMFQQGETVLSKDGFMLLQCLQRDTEPLLTEVRRTLPGRKVSFIRGRHGVINALTVSNGSIQSFI